MIHRFEKRTPHAATSEATADSIHRVKHVLKCLAKLISGKKIYAENHPTVAKFAKAYRESLRDYFELEYELVLSIERTVIKWEDEVVYENDRREESLAFLLYRDGVGEITIARDVSDDELDRLGDILKDEFHSATDEQDIVTRLWREDFEFISYRVLEDYLISEPSEEERRELEKRRSALNFEDHRESRPSLEDKGRVIIEADDPISSIDEYLRNLAESKYPHENEVQREEAFQSVVEGLLSITGEELAACHEQLRNESESENLITFMGEVIEFILLPGNPKAVRDVVNICRRIIDYITEKRKAKALSTALVLIRDFQKSRPIPEEPARIFRDFERLLCNRSLLVSLVADMQQGRDDGDVLDFLSLVGHKTIPLLCDVLRKLDQKKDHQSICRALVAIAGDDLTEVFAHLDIDNAQIALDTVYILRMSQLKTLSPKIRELIHYPDRRVKAEVISHLADIEDAEAETLLLAALGDSEEAIRIKALAALGCKNTDTARARVTSLAFAKELVHRSIEEQEAIFGALGRIGNKDTLRRIEKQLRKRHILHPQKNRHAKLLAVRALENMSAQGTAALLAKLADDGNDEVRSRARQAQKVMKKREEIPADTRKQAWK
jgi:hypothetical protein